MYTFDTSVGGRDEAGGINNTMTNYYVRKYVYLGWNKDDDKSPDHAQVDLLHPLAQMCLTFAEAANRVSGPDDGTLRLHPKQALAYLRSRPPTTECRASERRRTPISTNAPPQAPRS